ncbi:MAG: PEP-CTERM sorting domain-containing protein [Methyloprofundus sp.]|nr:PEP-CTERM sorting domain-containing protein [Methyloprofundus sp.]
MKKYLLNAFFISLIVSDPSFAGLIDVSKIVITPSTLNTSGWLQVSEVNAIETGTGNDLALSSVGAVATGSSDWPSSSANFAIDSSAPSPFPQIFHSNENDGTSFLNIVLASPSELDSITLFGRAGCCSNRDIYNIALFDSSGSLLFGANDLNATSSFHSVSIDLPNTANSVPEPAVVWLLASGLVGLIGMKKKLPTLSGKYA